MAGSGETNDPAASTPDESDLAVFDRTPRFGPKQVTHVLDAVATLQARRSTLAAEVTWGDTADTRITARGPVGINRWLMSTADDWRHVLSVRPWGRVEEMRVSLPHNERFVGQGGHMVSVFDHGGTTPPARMLLAAQPSPPTYLFAFAPLQLKILDEELVLLDGPIIDGEPTVMLTADLPCLTAADAYWRAVLDTSFPASEAPERVPGLTDRQRQVLALLTAELSDEQVAASIGVSVRTVRGEIARAMAELGVRSRFSLGRAVEDLLRAGRAPDRDG